MNVFQELEYDRKLITTLGVAQGRLYELRLQTSSSQFDEQKVSRFASVVRMLVA